MGAPFVSYWALVPPRRARGVSSCADRVEIGEDQMKHAQLVARSRKEHVKPTVCPGVLTPVETRRHWVKGTVETIYHCNDCQSVLGLVGGTVDWTMKAADWKNL